MQIHSITPKREQDHGSLAIDVTTGDGERLVVTCNIPSRADWLPILCWDNGQLSNADVHAALAAAKNYVESHPSVIEGIAHRGDNTYAIELDDLKARATNLGPVSHIDGGRRTVSQLVRHIVVDDTMPHGRAEEIPTVPLQFVASHQDSTRSWVYTGPVSTEGLEGLVGDELAERIRAAIGATRVVGLKHGRDTALIRATFTEEH